MNVFIGLIFLIFLIVDRGFVFFIVCLWVFNLVVVFFRGVFFLGVEFVWVVLGVEMGIGGVCFVGVDGLVEGFLVDLVWRDFWL